MGRSRQRSTRSETKPGLPAMCALADCHRLDEGVLLPGNDLEERVLGDHAPSSRARSAGSVAASMAVQASAMAPSRTAASAEGVMQAAANSC